MDPLTFCREMMSEYEEQWAEAPGHQERHPLRIKMQGLEAIIERLEQGEDFERLLQEGCNGDDAFRYLLCEDLRSRWEQQRQTPNR